MDNRTILAVTLSLIVLIGWTFLFPNKEGTKAPVTVEQPAPVTAPVKQVETTKPSPDPHAPTDYTPTVSSQANDITVETDLYKAVFTTQGAILKYWELKTHQINDIPVVLLKSPGVMPPLAVIFESPDRNLPQRFVYEANTKSINLTGKGSEQGELVFTYSDGNMRIAKRLTFHNDGYNVDLSVETQNTPAVKLPIGTEFGIFDREAGMQSHAGPVILNSANEKSDFDEGDDNQFISGSLKWVAQEDQYFTAALVPLGTIDGAEFWKEGASPEIAVKVQPGKHDFIFYAGPKEYDRLKALNAGLEHMIDFGWFAFIAMPLFWVLKYFYSYMGNYGWAIIVLTILVRVPFIPILNKSQQSMKKMQKVQPLMAELKEKYKNDAAKMQKETMALYKKHKVNPIGGCLPMFLQIPVFIALYNVLLKAIELRGAPFALWITDLAVKDPYYVMPIVMGATMVLQQKMTPTAMDPKQAKMMMLMPVVFTFMFLSFPAGLVLYWLVNNVLGIGQQYFVNKKAD
jgi:YidC/Oxa1 family membrane protein insertase